MTDRGALLEHGFGGATGCAGGRDRGVRWVAGVAAGLLVAAIVGCVAWAVLGQEVDVPDASSPSPSNYQGNVDAENWVGQTFVAERDNLNRISVVISAEERNDMSTVAMVLREGGPDGAVLRTVKLPIGDLPEGNPYRYRVGGLEETWTTFAFDAIPDSAGHTYHFSLEGKYIPIQNRVRVLMMFHTKYTAGKGYVNGEARDANVVFRAHSRGQVRDYLAVLARNLTAGRWGPLGSPVFYVGLAALYLVLVGALLVLAPRAVRRSGP